MAKPTNPLVVWARQDVTLPVAGGPNKILPIDDLLNKGYDEGEKPDVEGFNYILNTATDWVRYHEEERLPEFEQEIEEELEKTKEELEKEIEDAKEELDNKINSQAAFLVPVGGVISWPSGTAPAGWLECNGQIFNQQDNPKLFQVLGKNSVPDYRGLFLRGWAHGSSVYDPDSSRTIGSVQQDAMKEHSHIAGAETILNSNVPVATNRNTPGGAEGRQTRNRTGGVNTLWNSPNVSTENRPKNIAVMYIIKTDLATSSGTTAPSAIITSTSSITNLVGYTQQLTATVLPSEIANQYPVTWQSQDTSVATVSPSGLVTITGQGQTNIIASISTGMSATVNIVGYTATTSIVIADPGQIRVPDTYTLNVSRSPSTSTEPLSYSSSNPDILAVDSSGVISAISEGQATITVTATISGVSGTRSVTVLAAEVVETIDDIEFGEEQQGVDQAPPGCAITFVGEQDGSLYIKYKPIQKLVNGIWVTIQG